MRRCQPRCLRARKLHCLPFAFLRQCVRVIERPLRPTHCAICQLCALPRELEPKRLSRFNFHAIVFNFPCSEHNEGEGRTERYEPDLLSQEIMPVLWHVLCQHCGTMVQWWFLALLALAGLYVASHLPAQLLIDRQFARYDPVPRKQRHQTCPKR